MPRASHVRVVRRLTDRGYNADRDAVTVLANAADPAAAVDAVLDRIAEDALRITAEEARAAVTAMEGAGATRAVDGATDGNGATATVAGSSAIPTVSTAPRSAESASQSSDSPVETEGVESGRRPRGDRTPMTIAKDITGESTGTGRYEDFVAIFRDRYDRLAKQLRSRVTHRPTDALEKMPGGSDAGLIGMVNDIRSTASGHWLLELEDTNGVFPVLVMKDKEIAADVEAILLDEVIGVEGTLSDDGGLLFVDSLHFPDVPRTFRPSTADRPVEAALISDVHVGSQEFLADEWSQFADWLGSPEADRVEYLLIAGDMVEGVGVYPHQDEELDIVDIFDQYEAFSERLKEVPGDLDIVMIPGNHDAVRLAEPQPGFDEELRSIMSAHDAHISGNPSVVTIEGVSVLMYHGVSIDELVAELPEALASYDAPHDAMAQLLRKRHLAPQFGGHMRIAPEEADHLVIDDVPDVFHTGHVHKLGIGEYHNVRLVNSGCWQAQTSFQRSVNIVPDTGTAPILDLQTLDVTVRKFG